jgi:hypothetical protein
MFAYGAIMLVLLASPWKQWALDHSIAEVVSYSDRRVDNQVSGSVDEPMAIAGSAVVMFAGIWFGLFIPWVLNRNQRKQLIAAGFDPDEPDEPDGS